MLKVILHVFAYEDSIVIGQKKIYSFIVSVEKSMSWELGQWILI